MQINIYYLVPTFVYSQNPKYMYKHKNTHAYTEIN